MTAIKLINKNRLAHNIDKKSAQEGHPDPRKWSNLGLRIECNVQEFKFPCLHYISSGRRGNAQRSKLHKN